MPWHLEAGFKNRNDNGGRDGLEESDQIIRLKTSFSNLALFLFHPINQVSDSLFIPLSLLLFPSSPLFIQPSASRSCLDLIIPTLHLDKTEKNQNKRTRAKTFDTTAASKLLVPSLFPADDSSSSPAKR